jgi:membrane dipeptidase
MTDDMIRAVAKNNGVVMVNFYSGFVDENYRQAYLAQKPERDKAVQEYKDRLKASGQSDNAGHVDVEKEWVSKIPRPPFESLIDQIDHVAKVAGIDHVGLGSDFDGITSLPQGIDSVADLPKITEALVARGYSEQDMKKLLGENLLRAFRDTERVSREMNNTK